MRVRKSKKAGFTLVELMVVAIIVAILAAVAIPLMSGNKKRAAASEAEAALGTARSALRAMFAETGAYNQTPASSALAAGAAITAIPGVNQGDLVGRYWQEANYTIQSISASSYVLQATGSTDPNASGVTITLNTTGGWTRVGL